MNLEDLETRPQKDAGRIVSVSQLTSTIKGLLEGGLGPVAVRGEISNCKPATSGHIYFSLKDSEATISAALFRGAAARLKPGVVLKDGAEVICRGRLSVYAPRGTYQIIVESVETVGAGSLQAQFEALKAKLLKEGLFDQARKRPLPILPDRIVVITSPTGAAIRDVLSVLRRRFAGVKVLLIPALVQGNEAASELIKAIQTANDHSLGDVILLTRGGGSLEDLWAFNDERLARQIYSSKIPIVSAVGHEVDFTISDFVADLRAATPSAAAEILVREQAALLQNLSQSMDRLCNRIRSVLKTAGLDLKAAAKGLKNPKDRIVDLRLRFDDWTERLSTAVARQIERKKGEVRQTQQSLKALSPLNVLERGYSIAFDEQGIAIRKAASLPKGKSFSLVLTDGKVAAVATGEG